MYSCTNAEKGIGWRRVGRDVCYYQNRIPKKPSGRYYTLTWKCEFEHDYDTIYFAHSYPYTYSDL